MKHMLNVAWMTVSKPNKGFAGMYALSLVDTSLKRSITMGFESEHDAVSWENTLNSTIQQLRYVLRSFHFSA